MKTLALSTTAVVLALMMSDPEAAQSLGQGGTISGFVHEADDITAIPDAQVCVTDYDTGAGFGCAGTDAVGHYQMDGLPSGNYRVSAEAAGFVTEFFDDVYGWHDAEPVLVTAPDVTRLDFALELAGRITGTVTHGTTAIPDLHVYATDYDTGQWVAGVNTDSGGAYTLFVPTGTYRVGACGQCSGLAYAHEFYADKYYYDEATPVSVMAPDTTSGIAFALEVAGRVNGTVTDGATGISDLHVQAFDYDTNRWVWGWNTDDNGNYTLFVPTGTYCIRTCACCSGLPYADKFYNDTYDYNQCMPVSVTAPETPSDINFVLEIGGSISGVVYSDGEAEPIPNVQVWVSRCDGISWWTCGATTNEQGEYTITGLPDGSYHVTTYHDFCASGSGYIGEMYDDTHNEHDAICVEVTRPADTGGIDFYLAGVTLQPRQTAEEAIEDGIAWLAAQQNSDGSWGNSFLLATTGLAVLNLELYALRQDPPLPPLDPVYAYSAQVRNGLNFIFANAYIAEIDQQFAGNPDENDNGVGVYFALDGYEVYNTSIDMMPIAVSGAPAARVTVPGSSVDGWTYADVLKDSIEWLAWAQTDVGWGKGGWNYGAMDDEGDRSDQSNSGWASLALAYAEAPPPRGFALSPPGFARGELDIWINATQNDSDGGSVYAPNPDDPGAWTWYSNSLRTGNVLQQMAFAGNTCDAPERVQDAIAYLTARWHEDNTDPGWRGECTSSYQATYTIMKGLKAFGLVTIDSIDWLQDFTNALITQQTTDGSWPLSNWDRDNGTLSTNWALLTLQEGTAPTEIAPNLVVTRKDEEWLPGEEGRSYIVHFTVQNQGNTVAPPSDVGLNIDGQDVEQKGVPALDVCQSYSDTFDARPVLTGDCDTITICADPEDLIRDELNEDDNCQRNTWCGFKPDLAIVEKGEDWVGDGFRYTVHYILENSGSATAFPGHDVTLIVDHVVLESQEINVELGPGATYRGAFTPLITLTGDMDRVEAVADANGEVDESDEANNALLNWIVQPPAPDLIVHDVHEEWLVPGQSYFVHYEIRNIGNASAPAGHDARLEVDGVIVETQQVSVSLAPGASHTGVFVALTPFTHPLDIATVCADVNDEVAERHEVDNCYEKVVDWPPAPDLRSFDKFETWVAGYANQRYTVGVSVGNFGNAKAEAGHWVELSVDGDIVETKQIVVDLDPTQSYAIVFDSVIEISGECDDITVCADAHDDLTESDEGNNCLTNTWCCTGEECGSIPVDIRPTSCPNPLNTGSRGVLPVAILGTARIDVTRIDPASVRLAGVAPLRWSLQDVATPYEPFAGREGCHDCNEEGPDGFMDLTLKFDTQAIVAALGDVSDGDCLVLTLGGNLLEEYGGTAFTGEDVLTIKDERMERRRSRSGVFPYRTSQRGQNRKR